MIFPGVHLQGQAKRSLRSLAILPMTLGAFALAGSLARSSARAQLKETAANDAAADSYPLRYKKSEKTAAELVAVARDIRRRFLPVLLAGFRSCRFAEGMIHRSFIRHGSLTLKPWLIR